MMTLGSEYYPCLELLRIIFRISQLDFNPVRVLLLLELVEAMVKLEF